LGHFHQNTFPLGDISDVDLAEEQQEVVFAEAEHFNILDDHHLDVGHIEHCAEQCFLGVLLVAFGQILHGPLHAPRSVQQTITIRVLAELDQHFPEDLLQAGAD
jgi:hypothetical protein